MSLAKGIETSIAGAVDNESAHLKIVGGSGVGKTFVLTRRVEKSLQQGVSPEAILVLVSTPSAAEAFSDKLLATGLKGAEQVKVTTIQDLCVSILSSPEAIEITGRIPRILTNAEDKFLLEDMKVLGIKSKRLREMLKFFYREWTELGDDKEDFLIDLEEISVHDTIKKHLIVRRAMLMSELSNTTVHFLRENQGAVNRLQRPFVLVDDYQNLNKASQIVVQILASENLVVTGNENELVSVLEPYPYPEGFTNFTEVFSDAIELKLDRTLRCPQRIASIGNALALHPSMTPDRLVAFDDETPEGTVTVVKWPLPDDEFAGIAGYLKKRFNDEEDFLRPEDVFIAIPNKVWGRTIVKQLNKRHIKSTAILADQSLSGNPRELDKSRGMRAYTALNLLADSNDAVAWRSWCGFGDYLTNSGAWTRLVEWATENNVDVVEALDAISQSSTPVFLEADKLVAAYKSGKEMIARNSSKTGFGLLSGLTDKGHDFPAEVENLLEPIIGNEDAATFYTRASKQLLAPKFDAKHHVRVGTLESTCGLEARLMIFIGLIDGFLPSRDTFDVSVLYDKQDKIRDNERMLLYAALTKSSDELILSYFQKETLEIAEPLKMEVRRIRADHGKRMASLSPSIFIDEMGGSVPGAVANI